MKRCTCALATVVLSALPCFAADPLDWSGQQVEKLPASETPIRLFNGQDLTGWQGQTGKYFNVENGIIVARNTAENAPKASTYLVTQEKYRNFRLIFEAKLVTSEMHSGIALWGQNVEKEGDPWSYTGHLVMFPSGWGMYDLFGRNGLPVSGAPAKKVGRQHNWNEIEVLAQEALAAAAAPAGNFDFRRYGLYRHTFLKSLSCQKPNDDVDSQNQCHQH